jgi:acid stress-induced BolA-like protein IbaG/YrbA
MIAVAECLLIIFGSIVDCQTIKRRIENALPNADVTVQSNDNVHFEATVLYAGFEGHNRIGQHRMVYNALGEDLGHSIHALVLVTRIKEEA